MSQTQDELMRNVLEENDHIKNNHSDSSFEALIKPMKITSPLDKLNLCEQDLMHDETHMLKYTPRVLAFAES